MASDGLHTSWSESPFPNQMGGMIDQEWMTSGATYPTCTHPYATGAHANAAMLTPISLSDSVIIDPRQSPAQVLQQHQDTQYNAIGNTGLHHGLGITGTTTAPNYLQPEMIAYDHHHHQQQMHRPMIPHPMASPPEPIMQQHQHDRAAAAAMGHRGMMTPPRPAPAPAARVAPVSIAPNPAGLRELEQARQVGQEVEQSQRHTRQRRRPRRRSSQIEEENGVTQQLRDQGLSWKIIVERVNETFGKSYNISCLQMRMARYRQRMREWSEDDTQALRKAHNFWEHDKFEIISEVLPRFGAKKRWTAHQCKQKWDSIQAGSRDFELEQPIIEHGESEDYCDQPPARRRRLR